MPIHCPTCLEACHPPPELLARQGGTLACAHCSTTWSLADTARPVEPSRLPARRHHGPEIVAEARSARHAPPDPAFRRAFKPAPAAAPQRSTSPALAIGTVLVLLASGMAAVARKDLVVASWPPSAALFGALGLPVNLRGLALADMHGTVTAEGPRSMLTLEGKISNLRREKTAVPALRIAVRDKAHNELYTWTAPAPKPRLNGGETVVFRSRLVAPPEDGQDLMIRFAEEVGNSAQVRSERR